MQPTASTVAANSIPANYLHWFQFVGLQYNVPWTILAGIGKVESDDGQTTLPGVNSGSNAFGAAGPMQIGIEGASGDAWATYATVEDGDPPASVYDPADAIAAAAKYLIAHGVQQNVPEAIFAYNHADWYVQEVLSWASTYASGGYTDLRGHARTATAPPMTASCPAPPARRTASSPRSSRPTRPWPTPSTTPRTSSASRTCSAAPGRPRSTARGWS